MVDLLPCPFCGGSELEHISGNTVYCKTCKAEGPASDLYNWQHRTPAQGARQMSELPIELLEAEQRLRRFTYDGADSGRARQDILKIMTALRTGGVAQIPEVECAHRTLDKWNPNRADYIGDTPYTLDDRIDRLLEDMNASAQAASRPTDSELLAVLNAAIVALKSRDQSSFEMKVLEGLKAAMACLEASSSVSSTHQRCAKCGCETKGEAALVDGKVWCHPCADGFTVTSTSSATPACKHPNAAVWFYRDDDTYMRCPDCGSRFCVEPSTVTSTPRATPPLCGCKASQRDGQHMAWCPAISSTQRVSDE